MASLLLNNTTVASTTDRLHRHHRCKLGIEEAQQVVVMTRKLSNIRRISPSPSAHSFLFVLLLLFQLLSHVQVLALSLSSPLSVSSSAVEDPVAISALAKSSSSLPSITTTTDAAFHHLSEYNEWRASVDSKKIQEAISSAPSEAAAAKETTSLSNSSTTDKDGSLSPLFENAFASTSASRRNSLDEIMSSLDIDNSEQTTLDLLIGDDTNIFTEELNSSQPKASSSSSIVNQQASLPGTMRQNAGATVSTQKQSSQFQHIFPNVVPSSSSQIQKKEKKKKGRNKNPENPLLMLMRAAQLAPNFVLPILKNKSSQHQPIPVSSKPPKLTPKKLESTKEEGNSHKSKYNDKHMEMEMPILSPSSPLSGRMVEPDQILPQHPNDPSPREKQVSSTATATTTSGVDTNERKISTTSLSSADTSFSASSSEDLARDSHDAPNSEEPTSSNRIKLFSIMPDPLLSYSSGEENDSTEKRQNSLIPPASFIIESLAPLYQEFNTNNFKGLMLRKKSLPSFHTIKKRRLPRSIFVEVQANNRWKRYKVEGDKDEEEDRENKAPIDESRLALIRKKRNALYFNMLQNRLEGQKPLQLQQQSQQQRYPFPYPGISLPQYEQRAPTPIPTSPFASQPNMQSGQMNQFYNFQPQQRQPLTPTSGAPVRGQWSSQTVQNLSPLRQQLSRGPINMNNPQLRMPSNSLNNYEMPTAQSATPPPNVQIVPSTSSSGDNFLFKTPLPVGRPSSRLESRLTSSSPSPFQQEANMQRNLMTSPSPQFTQQRPQIRQQQPIYPFQSQQSQIAPNSGQQYPYIRGPMSPRIPQQQNPVYNPQQQQQRYQSPQYFDSTGPGPPRYSSPGQYTDIPARPGPSGTPFATQGQMPFANNYFQNQAQSQSQLPPSSQMQIVPYRSRVPPMTSSYGGPSHGPFYRNQGESLGTGMNQQPSVRMPSPYSSQTQQSMYPMQNRLYNDDPFSKFGRTGFGNAGRFETPSYSTTSPGYPRDTAASPINQANFGQYRGAQGYTSPSQQQWKQPDWPVGPRTPGPTAYSRIGLGQQQPQYYGQSINSPIQGQVGAFPNQQGPGKLANVDRKTPGPSQIQQQASEQPNQPPRYLTPTPTTDGTGGGWIPYQRNKNEQRVPAQQGSNSEFNVYPKYFATPQQQPRYPSPQLSRQQNLAPSSTQQFTQLERKQDTPTYGGFQVAQPHQQGQQNIGNQASSLGGLGSSQFALPQQQNVQRAEGISGYQYQQPSLGRFTPSQSVPYQQQNIQRAGNQTPSLGGTQTIQTHGAPSPAPPIQQQNIPRVEIPKQQDTSSVGGPKYTQSHIAPTQNIDAGRNAAPGKQGNPAGIQPHAQVGNATGPSHSPAYEQFIRSTTTPAPEVISGGERVLFRSKPSGSQPSTGGLGGSSDRQGGAAQGAGGVATGRSRGEFTLPIIENPQEKSQLQKQFNNGPTNQRPVPPAPQYQQFPGGQGQQGSNSEDNRPKQQPNPTQQFASSVQPQQPTPNQQFASPAQPQQPTPTQQFASPAQQQQQHQPGGGYGGGNFSLAGGSGPFGSASGQPQHLLDTSDRGNDINVGVGNSTSWGRTGDNNNNGREPPQAQRGGGDTTISRIQSGAEEGTQKAPESQPAPVEKAQVGKHLPHHGGDLPFYSQSELDAHHQRVSHNSQTPKDTEFENDSAILSWYLQRAKQELRHRQKSGRHKEPQEEARERAQATGLGSPSHQPRVRSAPFQPGDADKAQLRLSHPYSAGTSGDRPTTPFYNAAATSHQTQNSPFRRLSQVSYPSQMVQTSSNPQEIHSSAPSSGYQSYANQNGIPSLSRPRPASASPASSSSVPSQGNAAIYSYGSYPGNGGAGPVQQLNNPTPTRPKRSYSTNPWHFPS